MGPLLSVPYIRGDGQFAHAVDWFDGQRPPESLIFADDRGVVTLTGLRWRGHTGHPYRVGRLSPSATFNGRPRRLNDCYRVRSFTSQIDGLAEFAGIGSVEVSEPRSRAEPITAILRPDEHFRWRHDGCTHEIRTSAVWSAQVGQSFNASTEAFLSSTRARRQTPEEYLVSQWPLRALLVLAFGARLSWRGHSIKDESFPTWTLDGAARKPGEVAVQLQRTAEDAEQPSPKSSDLALPMLSLRDLGTPGLKRWYRLYDDTVFRRAVEPAVAVINGASRFLEPQLIMTAMSLEAAGYYRDPNRRPRERLERQVQRCVAATGHDWSAIGSERGIARAIAKTTNDLKHADRPDRPNAVELRVITDLAKLIMRMQILDLLHTPAKTRQSFVRTNAVLRVIETFELNGVVVLEDGSLKQDA
ncbi:hypothetical protein [Occultella kanbiaonis]|uniref:hypothetical protein n=1 Tax=Occultella kanbiaonis TaxID=2675754 RepID=UPI0012B99247|nr:hypothetical protein [Occultella kanbiaonis]